MAMFFGGDGFGCIDAERGGRRREEAGEEGGVQLPPGKRLSTSVGCTGDKVVREHLWTERHCQIDDDTEHRKSTFPSKETQFWTIRMILTRCSKKNFGSQLLSLDNMASGILVGPNQLPHIYEDLVEACEVLGIQNVPDLFIQQNSMPNAYTLAIQSRKPFIVIHTSLIELLTKSELQAVLAHELG